MTSAYAWQEISYLSVRGREIVLALSAEFLLVFVISSIALIAFRVASSVTIALSLAGSIGATSVVGLLYALEVRRSTERVAVGSDSLNFENHDGLPGSTGSIRFGEIIEIRAAGNRSGAAFVRTKDGATIRLGPGFGFGSNLLNDVLTALRHWAVERHIEVTVDDAVVSRVFRYKKIVLSEKTSTG